VELRDYIHTLTKRWKFIALLTVLGVAAAVLATVTMTPTYKATTQLFVSVQSNGVTASELAQAGTFSAQRVKSYADIASSARITAPVVQQLGLPESPAELSSRIEAEAPLDTVLINLSVTDTSPERAAQIANAAGTQFSKVVQDLERPPGEANSPVKLSVTQQAQPPTSPESPQPVINVALGLLVGLALGVGAAVLRETLDTSAKDSDDVETASGASVLGTIVYDASAEKQPLLTEVDTHSIRAEAYRQLRTNLQFIDVDDHPTCLVVTSSIPGEGKSTTAANLALAIAQGGSRVALVDGDMRRPTVAKNFGLVGEVGLTSVLIGKATVDDVVQSSSDGLDVITSGPIPPNPSELLGTQHMHDLLKELAARYDRVIIDTPPLLPVTDAAVMARQADGAVLVVRVGKTSREQVARAAEALRSVGAKLLGGVLSMAPSKGRDAYTYGYAYTYAPEGDKKTRTREREKAATGQRRA
jgi:polysaccharide biosynthesis transport protein